MTDAGTRPNTGTSAVSVQQAIDVLAREFAGAGLVFGHGTSTARDEAAWLVCALAEIAPAADPTAAYRRDLSPSLWAHIRNVADERIRTCKPMAYLLNEAWFGGISFYVDERVLVPRSPLIELLDGGFEPWLADGDIRRILDIGTGSGCIAIAAALAFPKARVDAADVSPAALEVAAINIERHQLRHRVSIYQTDVFAGLPAAEYDLIISNPPYVDAATMRSLPTEYQCEPALGLAAGEDGLAVVARILEDAHKYLSDHGILVVEVGDSQAQADARFAGLPFTWLELRDGASGVFMLSRSELPD